MLGADYSPLSLSADCVSVCFFASGFASGFFRGLKRLKKAWKGLERLVLANFVSNVPAVLEMMVVKVVLEGQHDIVLNRYEH